MDEFSQKLIIPVEPCNVETVGPTKMFGLSRSRGVPGQLMITVGPQLSVWIIQVSSFSVWRIQWNLLMWTLEMRTPVLRSHNSPLVHKVTWNIRTSCTLLLALRVHPNLPNFLNT